MQRENIPYELLTFEDEGHGIARPKNLPSSTRASPGLLPPEHSTKDHTRNRQIEPPTMFRPYMCWVHIRAERVENLNGGIVLTHTTRTFDKMGETTQTVVRTSRESARILTDYTVKAQELNTQFARRAVETWIEGLRKQTELSQDVAQELFGRAGSRQTPTGVSSGSGAPSPFPFGMTNSVMFPFQKQGMHSSIRLRGTRRRP